VPRKIASPACNDIAFRAGNSGVNRLFFLSLGFETLRANFFSLAVDLFGLKIDGHGSFGGDVGVRAALGGFGSAAADLASSTHKTHNT